MSQRFINFHHLDNNSSSIETTDELEETSCDRMETGTKEPIGVGSQRVLLPRRNSFLQRVSLKAVGNEKICLSNVAATLTPVSQKSVCSQVELEGKSLPSMPIFMKSLKT